MTAITSKTRIEYTLCGPKEFYLYPGSYKLEVVGAAGGNGDESTGGKGGMSYGTLTLQEKTKIFINIGEKGEMAEVGSLTRNACNGGGNARDDAGEYPGSGGGSTDIRIGSNDVLKRVIVAGGGGGGGSAGEKGGDGGGLNGQDGSGTDKNGGGGRGGQQTSCSGQCIGGYNACPPGKLLYGGNASYNLHYSGGGGGLFGGAASRYAYGAGGGSGYVFTRDAVRDSSITTLDTKYFLTNAKSDFFRNDGNGYVVITPINLNLPQTLPPTHQPTPTQSVDRCSVAQKIKYKTFLICLYSLAIVDRHALNSQVHMNFSFQLSYPLYSWRIPSQK